MVRRYETTPGAPTVVSYGATGSKSFTSLTVARGVLLEGAVYRVAVTATQARGSA